MQTLMQLSEAYLHRTPLRLKAPSTARQVIFLNLAGSYALSTASSVSAAFSARSGAL